MLRSSFFAFGIFIALWGASFMMVDKVVLHADPDKYRDGGFRGMLSFQKIEDESLVIDPPDLAAWFLLSMGSVTMLYSVALPKKNA